MNGRIYDPTLGRFLQADPIIQSPKNSQSFNRYAYVFNNPLKYTDPTGYSAWTKFRDKFLKPIAAVAITIWTGGLAAAAGTWYGGLGIAMAGGAAAGYISTGSLQGALNGAFSGALFYGIGSAFSSSNCPSCYASKDVLTTTARIGKIGAHALAGGIMSDLQGGKFGHGFAAAGVTQAFAPAIDGVDKGTRFSIARIIIAAVVGGTASKVTGGKFANGAITGAFSRAFNDELNHEEKDPLKLKVSAGIDDLIDIAYSENGELTAKIVASDNGFNASLDSDGNVVIGANDGSSEFSFKMSDVSMSSFKQDLKLFKALSISGTATTMGVVEYSAKLSFWGKGNIQLSAEVDLPLLLRFTVVGRRLTQYREGNKKRYDEYLKGI